MNTFPPGTNYISLHHAPELVAPQSKEVAEEARKLLKRCIEKNPNTPWADLARWELDKGWGLGFKWQIVPRPAPQPAAMPLQRPQVPNFPRM